MERRPDASRGGSVAMAVGPDAADVRRIVGLAAWWAREVFASTDRLTIDRSVIARASADGLDVCFTRPTVVHRVARSIRVDHGEQLALLPSF